MWYPVSMLLLLVSTALASTQHLWRVDTCIAGRCSSIVADEATMSHLSVPLSGDSGLIGFVGITTTGRGTMSDVQVQIKGKDGGQIGQEGTFVLQGAPADDGTGIMTGMLGEVPVQVTVRMLKKGARMPKR